MNAEIKLERLVTVGGKVLNLYEPRDADAFLAAMRSYGEAARCEWAQEYLLAERIVAQAIWDASNSEG